MTPVIGVLVVDDDPIACSSHVAYVDRVPGFRALSSATTAAAAIRRLSATDGPPIDLILLDMNLPDRHGLDIIRALRAGHRTVRDFLRRRAVPAETFRLRYPS
jgi:response regulator of citrate/malate metabolism